MEVQHYDNTNDRLLPCPFCGEKPMWHRVGNGTEAHYWTIQDARDGDVLASELCDSIILFKRDYEATHSFDCPYKQTERKPRKVKKDNKQLELWTTILEAE